MRVTSISSKPSRSIKSRLPYMLMPDHVPHRRRQADPNGLQSFAFLLRLHSRAHSIRLRARLSSWPSAPEERPKIAQGAVRIGGRIPGNASPDRFRPVGPVELLLTGSSTEPYLKPRPRMVP